MFTGNLIAAKHRINEDMQIGKQTRVEDVFQELMLPNWSTVANVLSYCLKHDLLVIFFTMNNLETSCEVLNIIPLGSRGEPTGFQSQNYVDLLEMDQEKFEVFDPICQVLPTSRLVFTACILQERFDEEADKGGDSIPKIQLLIGVFAHETEDNEDDYLSLVSSKSFDIPLGQVARALNATTDTALICPRVNFMEHRGRFFCLMLLNPSKPLVLIQCWHLRKFYPIGSCVDYPGLQTINRWPQTCLMFATNRNRCHFFAASKTDERRSGQSIYLVSKLKLCF